MKHQEEYHKKRLDRLSMFVDGVLAASSKRFIPGFEL